MEWLREQLRISGKTQRGLASALGIDSASVSRMLQGKRRVQTHELQGIATYLQRSMPEVAAGLGVSPPPSHHHADAVPLTGIVPGDQLVGEKDLPIYASAQGGPEGMVTDFEVVEWVRRPAPLFNVPRAFGIYLVGDSMEPAYSHGDMLLCHPTLPPGRGDDVLIVLRSEDNEHSCLVKRWVSGDGERLRLKQHNPPDDNIIVPRQKVQGIHVVVGKYNRR